MGDDSVRPGGTACRIQAVVEGTDGAPFSLTLTEFPDPDGQLTYFQVSTALAKVDDELLS